MSEIEKKNQNPNANTPSYDEDEDDLWEKQSTEKTSIKQIDFEETESNSVDIDNNIIAKNKEDIKLDIEEDKIESNLENIVEMDSSKLSQSSGKNINLEIKPEENVGKIDKNNSIIEDINSWFNEENSELLEDNMVNELNVNKEEISTVDKLLDIDLKVSHNDLRMEIKKLEKRKDELLKHQEEITNNLTSLVKVGLSELEQKKQNLEVSIQKLEKRKERIEQEMKTTFAGVSQDLAIRVQGFKDYLVGSLQDLAASAEQLELPSATFQTWDSNPNPTPVITETNVNPKFVDNSFKQEIKQIRSLLDQYRNRPDYYGPPWQLRRTFEPIHAERVANWFFSLGGRGAIAGMGSRLQNILVASAVMSILYQLYDDRSCTLILSDTPERLGEWRRGLQDCLGISRGDFGPNRGVTLFETPEALSQRAQRLVDGGDLPLIIIDQTDDKVSLSLLQFPLWLAFVADKPVQSNNYF